MALLKPQDTNSDKEMAFDFHFPTSKKALIIFTKNPELGKVKTRLAQTVGDESALKIYEFLLKHTMEITKDLNVDKYIFYSEEIHKNDIWDSEIFRKRLQCGNDLGERMSNAFTEIFNMGYQVAIIIGSDMFDLNKQDLGTAFAILNDHNIVVGPATDGGYYLLGMKEPKPQLFKNKNWGSHTILKETLEDLKHENHILLPDRNDIDIYEDIKDQAIFDQFLPSHLKKHHDSL
ncbi:glycosyltransferase [Aequorivita sp. H23M31]|uniref:Glycosyltransferase n=1 Tax=Aequorivita ciconiae TaxID=2494375 RepID=A0A410G675_9FLAO|nr:TIGR04282 family arsenosugar biosynthesis glycosyltransferase [Aequorivita sp. H23M31]QAA82772.1 glycosyltransferase [Aequorivita sp. H23M31]